MVGKTYTKNSNPAVQVKVLQVRGAIVTFHEVNYANQRELTLDEFNSAYTELTGQPLKNESGIRNQLRAALENMYMLGGMPKPEPKYEEYINRMIECVMNEVKKGQA